jgi:hypothetical protein
LLADGCQHREPALGFGFGRVAEFQEDAAGGVVSFGLHAPALGAGRGHLDGRREQVQRGAKLAMVGVAREADLDLRLGVAVARGAEANGEGGCGQWAGGEVHVVVSMRVPVLRVASRNLRERVLGEGQPPDAAITVVRSERGCCGFLA